MKHRQLIVPIAAVATLLMISGCGRQSDLAVTSPAASASSATAPSTTSVPSETAIPTPSASAAAGTSVPAPATPHYDPKLASGACVLTSGEATSILGAGLAAPLPRQESTVKSCTYGSGPATSATSAFLSLEFLMAPETVAAFIKRQADSGGTRVQGVGDAAFFIRPVGANSRQLSVHAGSTSFMLELQLPGRDQGALLAALQAVATTVISRLPA